MGRSPPGPGRLDEAEPAQDAANEGNRIGRERARREKVSMTEYRCAWLPGARWLFTVDLAERRGNRLVV